MHGTPLKQIMKYFPLFLLACLTYSHAEAGMADTLFYQAFINNVAGDIVALKTDYPQLVEFSLKHHVDIENLRISYDYHTHASAHPGGWTSGVPAPDVDGIWFYIDVHDHGSTAQIHTQPITGNTLKIDDKIICFLILEGAETRSVVGEIEAILQRHGATP